MEKKFNYVSLFSGAGIGTSKFKSIGGECLATAEYHENRMNIQRLNKIGIDEESYFIGDIRQQYDQINTKIKKHLGSKKLDLVIATPPCQGMSLMNHKKNSKEIIRNSLIVDSINFVNKVKPKIFIFENVRSFLETEATDDDGKLKKINLIIKSKLS
jgi:DNA (cytosine-5)-methyltransferase 1